MSVFCRNCSEKDLARGRGRFVLHGHGVCSAAGFTGGTGKFFRNPSYDFVHDGLGSKPVRIRSKRQWKEELKKRGMTDDRASRMDLSKFRARAFDSQWDQSVDQAIAQSIAEVKQKPYSSIGKRFDYSQVQQMLRREAHVA